MHIALAEDDEAFRGLLVSYLHQYEIASGQSLRLSIYRDGGELVEGFKSDIDLILLDIEMPFLDGMATARKIRDRDPEVLILFLTQTPQYAMKGYEVDALDYIVKPITPFALFQRLDRARDRLGRRKIAYLAVNSRGGLRKIEERDILYVEVLNHHCTIHLGAEQIVTKDSLGALESRLSSGRFSRCGQSFLVNLEWVDQVNGSDVVIGSRTIPLSRSRKKEFLDDLHRFIGGLT